MITNEKLIEWKKWRKGDLIDLIIGYDKEVEILRHWNDILINSVDNLTKRIIKEQTNDNE